MGTSVARGQFTGASPSQFGEIPLCFRTSMSIDYPSSGLLNRRGDVEWRGAEAETNPESAEDNAYANRVAAGIVKT